MPQFLPGQIRVRVTGAVLAMLVCLVGGVPSASAQLASSAWPMFQHDARHTGKAAYQAPGKLLLDWSFQVEGRPGMPVIGADGTIYLPTGEPNVDTRGYLYAINPDGTLDWRYEFPQPDALTGQVPVPGLTAPAIAADGTIYVHTSAGKDTAGGGNIISGRNYLFAINPDGTLKWTYAINNGSVVFTGDKLSSPAIATDGTVYFGSKDTGLYAVDPDGNTDWVVVPNGSSITSSPAVGPDGTVYIQNGDLFAYNANGTAKWTGNTGNASVGQPESSSVAADGTPYSCTQSNPNACHGLVAATGALSWSFSTPNDPLGAPAISSDGGIHFAVENTGLYALDDDGSQRWLFTGPDSNTPIGAPAIGSDDRVYSMRKNGGLYVVNSDGTQNHKIGPASVTENTDGSGIAIGPTGALYLAQHGVFSDVDSLNAYVDKSTPPDAPTIIATDPPSPSNSVASPNVKGTASSDTTTVQIFSQANCAGSVQATGTKATFEGAGITVFLSSNQTTTLSAKALDAVDNESTCSNNVSYTHDNVAPPAPSITSSSPASPSNSSTTPNVIGSASSDAATVQVYTQANCFGGSTSGSKATFEGSGIGVSVGSNATTTLSAKAVDAAGNVSSCSGNFSYTHDSVAPAAPTITSTSPASPSNSSTTPNVIGSSSADTVTVQVYTQASCAGGSTNGSKATFAGAGIGVSVGSNATTTLSAKAVDAAGNLSSCSNGFSYTHDDIAPSAPSITSTNPTSPSSTSTSPKAIGTASSDTVTVQVYTQAACAGSSTSGSKSTFEGTGITVSVGSNATTTLSAKAVDAAGNPSSCSGNLSYTHDSIAPTAPSITSTTPATPSNDTQPFVKGSSSSDTVTVQMFAQSSCGGAQQASGSKATFEGTGIQVTVNSNATTTLSARAVDAAGNVSSCSGNFSYTHDSIAPTAPSITSTNPTSPSNTSTTPKAIGTSSADTVTVQVYTQAGCGGSSTSGSKATFAGTGIQVSVGANATTTLSAKAVDAAGNVSGCSGNFSYTHDSIAPSAPSITSTNPASPSNNSTTPKVIGTSSSDTATVQVYSQSACGGSSTDGPKATFEGSGIQVSVTANTTTTFSAKAVDAAGNASTCSNNVPYTHDNIAPAAPSITSTSPASPSNSSTTPNVIGSSSSDTSTVQVYTQSSCGGSSTSGSKATFEGAGIQVSVGSNATTTLSAKAVDAVGNVSGCSNNLPYTHDSGPPAPPGSLSTSPASPANNNNPKVLGSAEAGSTVKVYKAATTGDCTGGNLAGTDTQANFASPGISASVSDNTTTTFRATATDAAGNTSSCSSSSVSYTEDSSLTEAPTISASNPGSPSNSSTQPLISGNAGTDAANVDLYTQANCGGSVQATGSKATFDGAGVQVTVGSNATTTISAKARDASENVSPCSNNFSYTHDSVVPSAPSITATSPASPSNSSTTPNVIGTSSSDTATVRVYTQASCAGGFTSGTKAAFEGTGIQVTAGSNTTTTISAKAVDAAGNVSGCSNNLPYTHDNVAPSAPSITSTNPASPSNSSTTPKAIGSSSSDTTTVRIYTQASCAGSSTNSSKAVFEGTGIQVSVGSNTTTTLSARAVDAAGNDSGCSNNFGYTHDSVAPAAPTINSTNPASPANDNAPEVIGSAGGPSTISQDSTDVPKTVADLGTANSTLTVAASGVISDVNLRLGSLQHTFDGDLTVTLIAPDSTTVVLSQNRGSSGQNYTSTTFDDEAGTPIAFGSAPFGGSFQPEQALSALDSKQLQGTWTLRVQDQAPGDSGVLQSWGIDISTVSGSGDVSTVKVYRAPTTLDCTLGNLAGTGTPMQFSSPGVSAAVSDNTTTTFRATATDAAGNTSNCSSSSINFVEDSTAPAPPAITDTDPNSPSNQNNPSIKGSAEAGSIVRLYESPACGGAVEAQGPAAGFASPGLVAAVASNLTVSFTATATDLAGNVSGCSAAFPYREDSLAPDTTITGGPPARTRKRAATLSFTSNEPGSTFQCSLDGAAFTACASPKAYSGLARRMHSFRVRAIDQAGHVDASPATRTWRVKRKRRRR